MKRITAKSCRKLYKGRKLKACLLKVGARKEAQEHPWAGKHRATRIAGDHLRENQRAYGMVEDTPGEKRRRQEWEDAMHNTFRDEKAELRFWTKLKKRHDAERWAEETAAMDARLKR